jgi:hypothetical protein
MLKQIQVEKLIAEKICQFRTYRALADTGYASEKYPHVAILVLGLCHHSMCVFAAVLSYYQSFRKAGLRHRIQESFFGTSMERLRSRYLTQYSFRAEAETPAPHFFLPSCSNGNVLATDELPLLGVLLRTNGLKPLRPLKGKRFVIRCSRTGHGLVSRRMLCVTVINVAYAPKRNRSSFTE